MIRTIEQITAILEAGELETAKKELLRYGNIIDLHDWETDIDSNLPKLIQGARRFYKIQHLDESFTISMVNGVVTKIKHVKVAIYKHPLYAAYI